MTGRTSSGQFATGNTFGKGRPRRQKEREYLAAMSEVCSIEDWQEIVKRAVTDAKAGDGKARQWLTNYLIGPKEEKSLETIAFQEVVGIEPFESRVKSWEEEREDREAFSKSLSKLSKDLMKSMSDS